MQIQEFTDEHGRRTVRVPLMLADSGALDPVQQQVARDTMVRSYAEERGVTDSQAAYEMRLGDAWKAGLQARAEAQESQLSAPAPTTQADNGQAAYEARLKAAWKGQAA